MPPNPSDALVFQLVQIERAGVTLTWDCGHTAIALGKPEDVVLELRLRRHNCPICYPGENVMRLLDVH